MSADTAEGCAAQSPAANGMHCAATRGGVRGSPNRNKNNSDIQMRGIEEFSSGCCCLASVVSAAIGARESSLASRRASIDDRSGPKMRSRRPALSWHSDSHARESKGTMRKPESVNFSGPMDRNIM